MKTTVYKAVFGRVSAIMVGLALAAFLFFVGLPAYHEFKNTVVWVVVSAPMPGEPEPEPPVIN